MPETEYAEIEVETIRETELAVLFTDGDHEFWVPKSQMEEWPDVGQMGEAFIAEWFAEEKGLI
jgi:hypothetical protein